MHHCYSHYAVHKSFNVCAVQSDTSIIRGQTYSECLTPIENEGAKRLVVAVALSGQWAPGPGFLVESDEKEIQY